MLNFRQALTTLWRRWLNRRLPATQQLRLSHRSVFILPSRIGLLYLALLIVMLLSAINYQNSLIYALVFWLFSLGLVAMLLTFRNLAGLRIQAGRVTSCFAGEPLSLSLSLHSQQGSHEALYLAFYQQPGVLVRVAAGEELRLQLTHSAVQRGHLKAGRLMIESRFPLGLFRVWSWVKLDFQALVYPQPETSTMILSKGQEASSESTLPPLNASGENDFYGLRHYQPGDSLKRIAWKQVARGKGMVSKDFSQPLQQQALFRYSALAPLPMETRLSRLCAWLLEAQAQGWQYGLELPNQSFALQTGPEHLTRCLRALALFGLEE